MGNAVNRYDFVLSGVLRVVFYRSFHMVSVPFPVADVLAYAEENTRGEGQFHGTLTPTHEGLLLRAWLWRGIIMGEGVTMDAWIIGARRAQQTVLVRRDWWKGNFALATALRAM